MLELTHISKHYNAGTVNESCIFDDFSLTVADHQFVSVVGSNGSGKTTLLNLICGSIPWTAAPSPSAVRILPACRNTNASVESDGYTRIRLWVLALP